VWELDEAAPSAGRGWGGALVDPEHPFHHPEAPAPRRKNGIRVVKRKPRRFASGWPVLNGRTAKGAGRVGLRCAQGESRAEVAGGFRGLFVRRFLEKRREVR